MQKLRAHLSRASVLLPLGMATLGAIAGCYTGSPIALDPPSAPKTTSTDGTEPSSQKEDGGSTGVAAATGLPCDVAELLATSCTSCHGERLSGGAPNPLVTYDDLAAPSEEDRGVTMAEVALARMKAKKRPMPPEGALPDAQIAVLERWIAAGLPRGTCGEPAAPADAGAEAATPKHDGGSEAGVTSVCSSGVTAEAGAPPSPFMKPGKACIACHSATGGPSHSFAGTVYKTLHEPNDCNGVAGGVSILLIDAAGVTHTVPVNAAGNFYRVTSMPLPYRAMVVRGNSVREMKTPQTDGDCNGCHSELGTKAPGRVMAP